MRYFGGNDLTEISITLQISTLHVSTFANGLALKLEAGGGKLARKFVLAEG